MEGITKREVILPSAITNYNTIGSENSAKQYIPKAHKHQVSPFYEEHKRKFGRIGKTVIGSN